MTSEPHSLQIITPARRRVMQDLKKLKDDELTGIHAAPEANNIMRWTAVIDGPQKTPFENGRFKVSLQFTEEYPARPPVVKFMSEMFHPNVFINGTVCVDILSSKWKPCFDASIILIAVQMLLGEPNLKSPANGVAATMFEMKHTEYLNKVAKIVERSWNDDTSGLTEDESFDYDEPFDEE